jgi:hypothetical protein
MSNGSCEPILDIYISITFQLYKKLVNARCFDLWTRFLKVRESTGTPIPQMGTHLGVWVFILTLSHISLGLHPCNPFCLGFEPKARIVTLSPTRRKGQCPHWHLNPFSLCNFFHLDPWPSITDLCGKTLPQAHLHVPKFPTFFWQVQKGLKINP